MDAQWSMRLTGQFHGFWRKIAEVTQFVPQDRISDRVSEQIVDVAIPKNREQNVEVVMRGSQERVQSRRNFNDVDERMAFDALAGENRARVF